MDVSGPSAGVTSSAGDVDRDGELVGSLFAAIGTAIDRGPYVERPGLDERACQAGVEPAVLRRLLRVPA